MEGRKLDIQSELMFTSISLSVDLRGTLLDNSVATKEMAALQDLPELEEVLMLHPLRLISTGTWWTTSYPMCCVARLGRVRPIAVLTLSSDHWEVKKVT